MRGDNVDGGPAFSRPCGQYNKLGIGEYNKSQDGMTLRQWYAGTATPGDTLAFMNTIDVNDIPDQWDRVVKARFMYADAMIKQGEKR